jgi:hypothetical protein
MCRSEPEALHAFEEEAKPGAATALTVGHDLDADGLLARDDARHFACQHLLDLAARDRPAQVQGDGVLEHARPEQAADHLGAPGRLDCLQGGLAKEVKRPASRDRARLSIAGVPSLHGA